MNGMPTNQAWRPHAVPGSIKPVYGAKYPPISLESLNINSSTTNASNSSSSSTRKEGEEGFAKFEASISDVWDTDADASKLINRNTASATAAQVIAKHAQSQNHPANVMQPHLHAVPNRNSRMAAMQRLAVQRENPKDVPRTEPTPVLLYPHLPQLGVSSQDLLTAQALPNKVVCGSKSQFSQQNACVDSGTVDSPGNTVNQSPDMTRYERIKQMLCEPQPNLANLRKECWKGIPHKLRPTAWRLLSGYLPAQESRRKETLWRKRQEYKQYVEDYFHTRNESQHYETFRQIQIDIPRMCPLVPLFQQKVVQEMFERILYLWAMRHPASGYVQGINDLVTPFFVVFLSQYIKDDTEVGTYDLSLLPAQQIQEVEADSFWCVSALLNSIQDNYTFAQPGIQNKVNRLQDLVERVDNTLHKHVVSHQVEYLQFAFRWMNNLLMREIPLRTTIRLWDTYLSESNGFVDFHVYVCAAFLRMWSKQILQQRDFQSIMILVQNLPTQGWTDQTICELTADAYSLMCLFSGAANHLNNNSTRPFIK